MRFLLFLLFQLIGARRSFSLSSSSGGSQTTATRTPPAPSGGNQYIHNALESVQRQTLLQDCFRAPSKALWTRAQIPPKNARILEIGCGAGVTTRSLAQAYPDATILAIDVNPDLIDTASIHNSDLTNVNWAAMSGEDAWDQLRQDQLFDAVWMRFVVVHVPDPQAIITSAAGCLKPGGRLLVEDCHATGWFSDPPLYACHMLHDLNVRASLEQEGDIRRGPWIGGYMREAGLSEISHETFCPVFSKGVETSNPWWSEEEATTDEQFDLGLQLLQQSLVILSPKFLNLGICSEEDISRAQESIDEVSDREYQVFCVPGGHVFQWIGKKPPSS